MPDARLPFAPEPEEALRARYPRAIARPFRPTASAQPECSRDHVFDWEDGLRLIAHRTRPEPWPEIFHLAARVVGGTRLGVDLAIGVATRDGIAQLALDRFRQVGGDPGSLRLVGWSDDGVAEWLYCEAMEETRA